MGHHERLRVTTTGRHKCNRQNLQQVSRPTNTIGEEATNILEAVEDNVKAEEVSSTKIEEDPNPRTFRQPRLFRKPRPISIKGLKHKFLLQRWQIAPRHVSGD